MASCHDSDPSFSALFDEAERLMESRSNLREAVALYELADASCSSLAAVDGQARAWEALGELAQARACFERIQSVPDTAWAHSATEHIQALDAQMAATGWGTLVLRLSPPEAEVALDGEPVRFRRGQLIWRIPPGSHHLVVNAEGHAPFSADIEIAAGGEYARTIELAPRPAALAPPQKTLQQKGRVDP